MLIIWRLMIKKILLRDLEDMLWYKNYQRYHLVGILEIHIMELRKIFWKKDYEDEYIPEIFAIDTYPIKEDSDKEELGVDYLKKLMQKCLILTYYT
jgi:uncharacterized protein (UPF0216 family)